MRRALAAACRSRAAARRVRDRPRRRRRTRPGRRSRDGRRPRRRRRPRARRRASRSSTAPSSRRAAAPTREVARIGQLTDTHVRDEESPARVPFLDRLGPPVTSTFRPQEALSAQVLAAAVRALNAERPQGVLVTGDLVDSAQRNELAAVPRGARRRARRPRQRARRATAACSRRANPDGFFYRPGRRRAALPVAARPARSGAFVSPGLRAPWWPARRQPRPDGAGRAAAVGAHRRDRHRRPRCSRPSTATSRDLARRRSPRAAATRRRPTCATSRARPIDALLAAGVPGDTTDVPADAERAHLRDGELLDAAARRGRAAPATGERLDYAVDVGAGLRLIVLDSVDRAGGAGGVITARGGRVPARGSSRSGGDRSIVVASHHGLHRARGGEAAQRCSTTTPASSPSCIGDTHRHEIRPVRRRRRLLADQHVVARRLAAAGPDAAPRHRRRRQPRARDLGRRPRRRRRAAATSPAPAAQLAYLDAQGGRPQRVRGDSAATATRGCGSRRATR